MQTFVSSAISAAGDKSVSRSQYSVSAYMYVLYNSCVAICVTTDSCDDETKDDHPTMPRCGDATALAWLKLPCDSVCVDHDVVTVLLTHENRELAWSSHSYCKQSINFNTELHAVAYIHAMRFA